jgi:hypothetical protein
VAYTFFATAILASSGLVDEETMEGFPNRLI